MSSYTMTLKEVLEMVTYGESYSTNDRIEKGRQKLFDFDYPIFDTNYKKVFETHFIRNFFMREIGFETEGLFKFQLETWLIINMPYFNKLFESELIKFNPLENANVDVTHNKKNETDQTSVAHTNGTSNGTRKDDNFDRQLKSNNPDSRLSISSKDGEGVIEYASEINENNENNIVTSDSENTQDENVKNDINSVEDFIQHRQGKIGVQTYSKMVNEFRSTFLRIEKQIFNEMNELFMLVY